MNIPEGATNVERIIRRGRIRIQFDYRGVTCSVWQPNKCGDDGLPYWLFSAYRQFEDCEVIVKALYAVLTESDAIAACVKAAERIGKNADCR